MRGFISADPPVDQRCGAQAFPHLFKTIDKRCQAFHAFQIVCGPYIELEVCTGYGGELSARGMHLSPI